MHEKLILIVEDNKSTSDILKVLLSRVFKDIIIANNGSEGLDRYNDSKPDLIITDLCMPIMSGFEMVTTIRSFDGSTPIIVNTAYHDEAVEVENFVDNVLYKPINKKELYAAISETLKVAI